MRLLIDNMSLEAVKIAFEHGLLPVHNAALIVERDTGRYHYEDVPFSGVQLEVLISLLVEIVIADELLVAEGYEQTRNFPGLRELESQEIVRPIPIDWKDPKLSYMLEAVLDRLCVSQDLRHAVRLNREAFHRGDPESHKREGIIAHGASSYLTRSEHFQAPYSGHPLRRRLIEQSGLTVPLPDASTILSDWQSQQRVRYFDRLSNISEGLGFITLLPPIAIQIIEDCQTLEELIPKALQLRREYKLLRQWLRMFQEDLIDENVPQLSKRQKLLDSVGQHVMPDRDSQFGTVYMNLGIVQIELPISGKPLESLKQKFGVRAILNGQIVAKPGRGSIKRLLKLFGEERSEVGKAAQAYLHDRFCV